MNEELFGTPVRRLTLKRRRSPLPWIYVVYHARDARTVRDTESRARRYASVWRRRNAGTSSGSNSGPGVWGAGPSISVNAG
jgi:hypothetical protein